MTEKKINLNSLKLVVLDEIDELLSDGINDKLEHIFNNINCFINLYDNIFDI